MSEELYNSSDYCSLAEQYEELKKENAELTADKILLMNLFMESSEYVFSVVSNMKINDLERKCKALKADYVISNRELLILQAELARRDEIIARLKEDAERLATMDCQCDEHWAYIVLERDSDTHSPDCPITLHHALMKELE
jgi:hypothetical protein